MYLTTKSSQIWQIAGTRRVSTAVWVPTSLFGPFLSLFAQWLGVNYSGLLGATCLRSQNKPFCTSADGVTTALSGPGSTTSSHTHTHTHKITMPQKNKLIHCIFIMQSENSSQILATEDETRTCIPTKEPAGFNYTQPWGEEGRGPQYYIKSVISTNQVTAPWEPLPTSIPHQYQLNSKQCHPESRCVI